MKLLYFMEFFGESAVRKILTSAICHILPADRAVRRAKEATGSWNRAHSRRYNFQQGSGLLK